MLTIFSRWLAPFLATIVFAGCSDAASVVSPAPAIPTSSRAVQVLAAIPFSADGHLALDLYLPAQWSATERRPVAVLIHGGGWSTGDRNEFSVLARWLAEQGMVAATIDYRLAPTAKWPAQGIDVAQSVWWLRNSAQVYGIDPRKIVAIGGSAGGHLAAMLGVAELRDPKTGVSSKVQAVVSLWGPWNLTTPETSDQRGMLSNLLVSPTDAYTASPFFKITSSSPPTLLFHGTNDTVVPYRQSVDACTAFTAASARFCQLVTLEGLGHRLPDDLNLIINPLRQFLTLWKDYVPASAD